MEGLNTSKLAWAGFLLALVILAIIAVLSFLNTRKLKETSARVAHTYEVIIRLEDIFITLRGVESEQRDYVITGEEVRLEHSRTTVAEVGPKLERIKALTADNPGQQERIARLEGAIATRLSILAEVTRRRREEGFESAQQLVLLGQGRRAMDDIRVLIAEMDKTENELLARREAESKTSTRTTIATFFAGLALSFALLLFVFYLLNHQIAERQRAEQGLTEQSQQLTRSEQALLEQTSLLQLVLASIGDGVCVSDENGKFLVFNPAAEQILKSGPATGGIDQWTEAYGMYLPDKVTPYPPRELPLARAIRGESVDAAELFMRNAKAPHGTWLTVTARPIRNEAGVSRGGVEVFSDITERKLFERALEEKNVAFRSANTQLEAANTELEAFGYSVSHDLRAPLRHLAGFAQMLRKNCGPTLDESGTRYLDVIQEAAGRMGDLIDNLLTFSRLGRAEMQKVTVDLNKLLQTVIADLQDETRERKIQWSIGDLPSALADPALLRQVFINLVSNALKFTRNRPRAEIEVGSRENEDELIVLVRDNGAGFDMKYADKLFGVFQRLHRADEFEGTGIGLANVRRIILRHGGKTWAESRNGEGATFYFSLPVTEEKVFV